jgi:hypothetical protein
MRENQHASVIIQFIGYVWWLLHVSALYCHPQGACNQVTQVFEMQLLVIQFIIKMFHIGFMQVTCPM